MSDNLDFKKIRPAHLLSTFGQQEPEECFANILAIVGEDTSIHFRPSDLESKANWVSDFLYGKFVIKHNDGTYTITPKAVDYIKAREGKILERMARGNTYQEVLGITDDMFKPLDKVIKKET